MGPLVELKGELRQQDGEWRAESREWGIIAYGPSEHEALLNLLRVYVEFTKIMSEEAPHLERSGRFTIQLLSEQ